MKRNVGPESPFSDRRDPRTYGTCDSDARTERGVDLLRVTAHDQQRARTVPGDGQCTGGTVIDVPVGGDDDHGTGSTAVDRRRASEEDVVTGIVLGPVRGLSEGEFVCGPGVVVTRGEHQDVPGRPPGVQEQIDGLVGCVERAAGRGRDQLELRRGTILRLLALGRGVSLGSCRGSGTRGCGKRALRRGRGPRGAGARMPGTRRGRGTRTRYGTGGRRGAAGGRSGAGTLDALGNLRLLVEG